MRILNFILAALMVLFAYVQHNDPDGPFWAAIYLTVAVFCVLTGLGKLNSTLGKTACAIALLGSIGGMVYYWPRTENFWQTEVWWETETAREGMGMMIVVIVLAVAFLTTHFSKRVFRID